MQKLTITDLNGHQIEVTDLVAAVEIAADFKEYKHRDKRFSTLDAELKAYWTDMHSKLLKLNNRR